MADKKLFSAICTGRAEVLSRTALLEWINSILNTNYKKIEDLCSGVAYCQIVELFYPNYIGKLKIKSAAKLEYEYIQNFKLLQLAFNKMNINKTIPIDRLVRGKFQDNLEFLQWFKKFYDMQLKGAVEHNLNLQGTIHKNSKVSADVATTLKNKNARSSYKNVIADDMKSSTPPIEKQSSPICPVNDIDSKETLCELEDSKNIAIMERDYYYKKFLKIENLLNRCIQNKENVDFCTRALKILRATDGAAKADNAMEI